jgi:hypothetical protein
MSAPGKGRYTTYVPAATTTNAGSRYSLLWRLFNQKANALRSGIASFYGESVNPQTDNAKAAEATVKRAKDNQTGLLPESGIQSGDLGMFPSGVDLTYKNSPNLEDVSWASPGDPANSYVPDVTSPGPGAAGVVRVDGLDKDANPSITPGDIKSTYRPGEEGSGTRSPSDERVNNSLGDALTPGKSSV